MPDDAVEPQNSDLSNSPKVAGGDIVSDDMTARIVGGDCYWNDKRYSDGGTVCDSGQRYKCWSGKWVDIGNC